VWKKSIKIGDGKLTSFVKIAQKGINMAAENLHSGNQTEKCHKYGN
jgi:hypothetical protein